MDSEEFYITVFSNNSIPNFPKNTLSTFTNLLHYPSEIGENWKVGLKEIYFNSIKTILRSKRELETDNKVVTPSIFIPKQLLHLTPFKNIDDQNLSNVVHIVEKENVEKAKKVKTDVTVTQEQQNSDDIHVNIPTIYIPQQLMHLTPSNQNNLPTEEFVSHFADRTENDESNNSSAIQAEPSMLQHKADNADLNDEIIKDDDVGFFLPTQFIELLFNYFTQRNDDIKKVVPTEENKTVLLFVYTDIMKPRIIGNQATRCLKIIPSNGKSHNITFDSPEYYPVEQQTLRTLSIQIANDEGQKIDFESSSVPTYCVLHFIKEKTINKRF